MVNEEREANLPTLERSEFTDESLWLLYLYWHNLPREHGLPVRKSIDPTEIPSAVLPFVFMIDVEWTDDSPSFHYRLAGTKLTYHYGFNFVGMTPVEAFPDNYEFLAETYTDVAVQRVPSVLQYQAPLEDKKHKMVERLLCPCTVTTDRVDLLFGGLAFTQASGAPAYG